MSVDSSPHIFYYELTKARFLYKGGPRCSELKGFLQASSNYPQGLGKHSKGEGHMYSGAPSYAKTGNFFKLQRGTLHNNL